MKILVIDDDRGLRRSVQLILSDAGYEVVEAADGRAGLEAAREHAPEIILCDVRMPRMNGLEFLDRYVEEGGGALVVVMTAYGSMDMAVDAMKRGAYDYVPKPFGADQILLTLEKARERESLRREVGRLREEVRSDRRFGDLVVRAPSMVRALQVAVKVAPHDSPVLIRGESGTGKELVARLIHRESARGEGPFVPVNCGAIPAALLESEFFGHVKGAFTGADRDREGLFATARGGTLFLDEVGELPPELQVKLLRVLQEGEVRPLGGDRVTTADARIVAATNIDLEEAMQDGRFRQDLYYRLAVVPIELPPLRRRTEEIPALAHYLLERHARRLGLEIDGIAADAMECLLDYPWPGNVRELENVLERALILCDGGRITALDLPEAVADPSDPFEDPDPRIDPDDDPDRDEAARAPVRRPSGAGPKDAELSLKTRGAELERTLIVEALARAGGNKTRAAGLLEISPRTLRYKLKDYDIE